MFTNSIMHLKSTFVTGTENAWKIDRWLDGIDSEILQTHGVSSNSPKYTN